MSSSTAIPTSTSVLESAVINAPLSAVWHHIKLQDFSKFWSAIKSSEYVKGTSDETDIVKWSFQDGTELEVKQEEHSVCSAVAALLVCDLMTATSYARTKAEGLFADISRLKDNQPLHHVLRHHLAASAQLHLRRQHHPLLPSHQRPARGQHVRRVERQLQQ